MKRTIPFLLTALFFCCNMTYADELKLSFEAKSGDRELVIPLP